MIERLGGEIRRELGRFGPAAGMAELVRAWPGAVGEQISRNAWPARFARDGTLHVATSSSAWAFELAQLEATLRARLEDALGADAPPRLRFAPGPLPEAAPEAAHKPAERPPPPSPELRLEGERLAAAISDTELRKLVAKAASASLARSVSDRSV